MIKEKYKITGMTCAACQNHVSKAVKKLDGVESVSVNLLTNSMEVEYDDKKVSSIDICNAVSNSGYGATPFNQNNNKEDNEKLLENDNELKIMIKRLVFSFIFLIPLVYLSMGYMMSYPIGFFKENVIALGLVLMILSFIIMLINKKFFISGFKAVLHKSFNMDTLVSLGSGVAFIYSVVILFIMSYYATIDYDQMKLMKYAMNLSFETAGMVPTLITIGKTLEAYSKGKTTNALKSLMSLAPKKATVIRDGVEVDVDIDSILVGEEFIVHPGERIPLDGVILEGNTSVDEAMLTGESIPNDKEVGSSVYQGTNNINGHIKCKSTKASNDTTLKQIIQMVFDATQSKAPISRIADIVAGIFVPIVIGISIVVFALWMILGNNYINNSDELLVTYALSRALSVLVISCPCALGLATPVAIMVSSGVGARNGVLFKNAISIETFGKTNIVVLDKTGTITKGMVSVSKVIPYNITEEELLIYAASLEVKSAHPFAKSIVDYANEKNLGLISTTDFNTLVGSGVYATINGKKIYGVNLKTASNLISIENNIIVASNELSSSGMTPLFFILDNKLIGVIAVSDEIKEDSIMAISNFKKLGITPVMLTGDNEAVASYIAKKVGIDYYFSDVLPNDKKIVVECLKALGNVAMIGDGINDSVALSVATNGVAIGNGSDIAIDSSDVVLVKSSLEDAVLATRLSKNTLKNIKENLFWAFIYNIIMIPIAAGAFAFTNISYLSNMKPWYGAASMSLSSIFVVLNSLRLNLFKKNGKILTNKKEIEIKADFIEDINNKLSKNINKKEDINKYNAIIEIEGMMCEMCVKHVYNALDEIEGISNIEVSLEKNQAIANIGFDILNDEIKNAIEKEGYVVKNIKREV